MANLVFIACSLDGFIAKADGDLDWLTSTPNETGGDFGFAQFLARVDAIVMGRATFEAVLPFPNWPYSKPVFVLSNSMRSVPESVSGRAEILTGPPREIVAALDRRGYHNLYIDGGKTIRSFLREDLIDEMIISRVSVLLGSGIPLFGEIGSESHWRAVKAEVLSGDLVQCRYVREISKSR